MKLLGGACLFVCLFASVAASTDPLPSPQPVTPPAPPPGETLPDWPATPVVPQPMPPQPAPKAVASLAADELYVVQSDDDVQLLASPPGVVLITKEQGPIRVRGKFADNTRVSTRTYQKKNVFIVERIKPGDVELLLVPAGKVERRVVGDDEPIPPPKPKPDDPPAPKPPEPVTSFRVIFVYESGDPLTPAMQQVMFGEKVRNYLDGKTTAHPQGGKGWRRFDRDIDIANERDPDLKALWQATKPQLTAVPCVVVATNRKAEILPLPADEDAAVKLFEQYLSGGK